MKEIQPISIWYNGQSLQAVYFNLYSVSDDLSTNANFNYQLFANNNILLTNGSLIMTGNDYNTYSTSSDSNNYAYEWAATNLNLTII